MKRIFVETNDYNLVLFVDKNNKAFAVPDGAFDSELTLEIAIKADYANYDGCETAEECRCAQGLGDVFDYNENDYDNVIEF